MEREKEEVSMQAAIFRGAFAIQVEQIPDAAILEPTDAVVQITHACICGTDLWPYRGQGPYQPGWQIGHEWMGMVMDVGREVRTIKRGDRVIASYDFCDGTCEFCQKGLDSAGVRPGGSVVVIGDGAVGLCATLAARRLGAERIIALGHQPHRLTLARQFGATEVITSSGEQATGQVLEMTQGGAEAVLECVGTEESITMEVNMSRPGGTVGFVGAPHGSGQLPLGRMFSYNIGVRGGLAPARAYLPELLEDVLAGRLDPSPILDFTVSLAEVASVV